MILAGVHGDERCGVEALRDIVSDITIERGTLFLGYGNPRAIEQNVRFTEANLNRLFKPVAELSRTDRRSYEYQRAKIIKKYLDRSSALLDIHASFTPDSTPFLICEPNATDIVRGMPFDFVISGFDSVEPGGTDYYMNRNGKIGICAECGYLGDPSSTERAKGSIWAFLSTQGHIDGVASTRSQSFIEMYELYHAKTTAFALSQTYADFEVIPIGATIATDGKKALRATEESVILFARPTVQKGEEAYLLGRYKKDPR